MNQSIGPDQPEDRTDRNRNGVADRSERDFKEAGQTQQPSPLPPTRPAADKDALPKPP